MGCYCCCCKRLDFLAGLVCIKSSLGSVKMNCRLYSKRVNNVEMTVRNSSLSMRAAYCSEEVMDSNCLRSINVLMAVTTSKKRDLSQILVES